MHIAANYKVPTISIFGPTRSDETAQWNNDKSVVSYTTRKLLILNNPMVPHIAEELWEKFVVNKNMISDERWPIINTSYEETDKIKIPVQVNGRMRAIIEALLHVRFI